MAYREGSRVTLVTMRATESERVLLRAEASRRGMTAAELIRSALEASGVPLDKARNGQT